MMWTQFLKLSLPPRHLLVRSSNLWAFVVLLIVMAWFRFFFLFLIFFKALQSRKRRRRSFLTFTRIKQRHQRTERTRIHEYMSQARKLRLGMGMRMSANHGRVTPSFLATNFNKIVHCTHSSSQPLLISFHR